LAAWFSLGCQEEEPIRRYKIPREETEISYATPEGWQKQQKLVPMSVATLHVRDGDQLAVVTITPLAGEAGGLLDNVNRWRGRDLKLPPVNEEQLRQDVKTIRVAGLPGHYVDLTGPEAAGGKRQRVLGVILKRGDRTWFFKMLGPAAVIEKQKAAFEQFLDSVRFAGDPGANHG
jgi:hypothetical protein